MQTSLSGSVWPAAGTFLSCLELSLFHMGASLGLFSQDHPCTLLIWSTQIFRFPPAISITGTLGIQNRQLETMQLRKLCIQELLDRELQWESGISWQRSVPANQKHLSEVCQALCSGLPCGVILIWRRGWFCPSDTNRNRFNKPQLSCGVLVWVRSCCG